MHEAENCQRNQYYHCHFVVTQVHMVLELSIRQVAVVYLDLLRAEVRQGRFHSQRHHESVQLGQDGAILVGYVDRQPLVAVVFASLDEETHSRCCRD